MLNLILIEIIMLFINVPFIYLIYKHTIFEKSNLFTSKIEKLNLLKRGKYISILANCISCHTPYGSRPFSGGIPIKTKFGTIFTPNITSSKLFGTGNLKLINFKNTMKLGISKNYEFLYPALPYIYYSKMKNLDINSIFLYIKSLPAVESINRKNILNFPFKYRKLLFGWRLLFFKDLNINYKKIFPSIIRGKYLIENLGHCNMCHGKLNNLSGNIRSLNYMGNNLTNLNWESPNLIKYKNLSKQFTIQDLQKILSWGWNNKISPSGAMAEIINNSLQNISKPDILSISDYMNNIFNKNYSYYCKYLKLYKNSKNLFDRGRLLFTNNCIVCHGKLLLGKFPVFPKINNISNKYEKNLFNIIYYTNNKNTIKNKFNSIMPNFLLKIKKVKLANLLNYLYINNNLRKY